jgi:hypothetical protein
MIDLSDAMMAPASAKTCEVSLFAPLGIEKRNETRKLFEQLLMKTCLVSTCTTNLLVEIEIIGIFGAGSFVQYIILQEYSCIFSIFMLICWLYFSPSVVNPLPCTATQMCFFFSRGECRNGPMSSSSSSSSNRGSCRFYHWTVREKHLFEQTGVLPFYAGAGDAFSVQPSSLHEFLYKLPRTLRERMDTITRPGRNGQGAFFERDFNEPRILSAIAALSVR